MSQIAELTHSLNILIFISYMNARDNAIRLALDVYQPAMHRHYCHMLGIVVRFFFCIIYLGFFPETG